VAGAAARKLSLDDYYPKLEGTWSPHVARTCSCAPTLRVSITSEVGRAQQPKQNQFSVQTEQSKALLTDMEGMYDNASGSSPSSGC
jgi:hypothetical protein